MAKSERPGGKRGDGNFNRKEGGGFRKEGGARGARPARREEGDRPYRREEGDKPSRKPSGPDRDKPFRKEDTGDRKPYKRDEGRKNYDDRKPYRGSDGEKRSFDRSGDKPFRKDGDRPYRSKFEGSRDGEERKPYKGSDGEKRSFDRGGDKPFRKDGERPYRSKFEGGRDGEERKPYKPREEGDRKPYRAREEGGDRKPFKKREEGAGPRKPMARKPSAEGGEDRRRSFGDREGKPAFKRREGAYGDDKPYAKKAAAKRPATKKRGFDEEEFAEHSNPSKPGKWDTTAKNGPMTLNKYLAHSGVSSRRDAAAIIKEGKVSVNGKVLNEPGYRVQEGDKISLDGKELKPQKHFVYVLLNKPKDFITTTEDDKGRRTVMELVSGATEDRLYPVGRLDRNTTGVLLLTNDGDLAQKLSHPRYESKKIYQVSLDKDVTKRDFDQIMEGVQLEDGLATVDRLAYLDKKSEIGLEIHSGRNRIVRRIFEHLGYDVVKLDRVMYAGLTKKNVSRGKWRFLTEKEVITLKHFRT